ncbi:MAG: AfsR/SARP family transcriptional regulator, partial [Actinomycetota bacterium]|nr:AfsR/SARP family transcriptional regulator [Actinomycetota bacterium]
MGISVLGPLEVGKDSALGPRDRIALAVLAMHVGQWVTPDRLADAVWGEVPPKSWNKVVQGAIVRLRRALGPTAIVTVGGGYRLTLDEDDVDARKFERLLNRARGMAQGDPERAAGVYDQALALWRGRPLPELDGWPPGVAEAARLEELRRCAQEDRLESLLAAGQHRLTVAQAEMLTAEEPLRERRWAILALAQYRDGRQGEALRTIARARRTLAEQLGLDPGSDLVTLEKAILRQDAGLSTPALAHPRVAREDCPYLGLVTFDVGDAESFFGRDEEIARCLRRLTEVSLLAIVGASGSGKSSL